MFKVEVSSNFSSAHNLIGYRGRCEDLHGHNWKVKVTVAGRKLDRIGMLVDFKKIKSQLNKVLDALDHKYLNEIDYFKKMIPIRNTKSSKKNRKVSKGVNPTSENIAKYIYNNLIKAISRLESVSVWESDNCLAIYYGK